MERYELTRHVVNVLERCSLGYSISGGAGAIHYGEPRFTNDLDVVVKLKPEDVDDLCRAFPAPEYCVSPEAARHAATHGGQFNIIQPATGLKVDVIVATSSPFDRQRFARISREEAFENVTACMASPEDVIIKKM